MRPRSGKVPTRGKRGSSTPKDWSNKYSVGLDGSAKVPKKGNVFRMALKDELKLPHIMALDEAQSEAKLREFGFLPGLPPAFSRTCWNCNGSMRIVVEKGEQYLRCNHRGSDPACDKRFNAKKAYTPLLNSLNTWNQFLRAQWCYSRGYRLDQSQEATGMKENRIGRIFAANRDVVAWFQVYLSKRIKFQSAEVDVDAAKTIVQRSGSTNTHRGRLFILKERATGLTKIVPLRDRDVEKGDALPPESNADIEMSMRASLRAGSLACGDGGGAIASSAKKAGVPTATALHGRKPVKQFTRLVKIQKSEVGPELKAILQKQGRWDDKSDHIRITGGNQAEGMFGVTKGHAVFAQPSRDLQKNTTQTVANHWR